MFSALEVFFNENALYKFTFDIDIDMPVKFMTCKHVLHVLNLAKVLLHSVCDFVWRGWNTCISRSLALMAV